MTDCERHCECMRFEPVMVSIERSGTDDWSLRRLLAMG